MMYRLTDHEPMEDLGYCERIAAINKILGELTGVNFELQLVYDHENKKTAHFVPHGGVKYDIVQIVMKNLHLTRDDYVDSVSTAAKEPLTKEERAAKADAARDAVLAAKTMIEDLRKTSHFNDPWPGWPCDAESRSQQHAEQFPWLAKAFGPRTTPAKCPVWEQAADDLADSKKFKRWVIFKLGIRILSRNPDQAQNAVVNFLPYAVRHVVGKAAQWPQYANENWTWLEAALMNCENPKRAFLQEETGRARGSETLTFSSLPSPADVACVKSVEARYEVDTVEAADERQRLQAAITKLPAQLRTVVELIHIEERSHAAAAKLMGVTNAGFKVLLHKAFAELHTLLSPPAA